jgi:hypothetical protein
MDRPDEPMEALPADMAELRRRIREKRVAQAAGQAEA